MISMNIDDRSEFVVRALRDRSEFVVRALRDRSIQDTTT
jgi:hypothetical protein